jgi:uncharacterized protein (TIGR02145 family)
LCGTEEYTSSQTCEGGVVMGDCDGTPYNATTHWCNGGSVEEKTGLTDARDGKTYRTVVIATGSYSQVWMAENLAYGAGAKICDATYGCYYTWAQAMAIDSKYNRTTAGSVPDKYPGICPSGWHLPSDAEWTALTNAIGSSNAGTQLKANDALWSTNTGANVWGFSALPGGRYDPPFLGQGSYGAWWSTSELDDGSVWERNMNGTTADVSRNHSEKSNAFNVRCAKD